jgi:hypothetical protein
MNQTHDDIGLLILPLVLLAAAVVACRRGDLRLSPIVAYLAAGVVIGPFGVGLIRVRDHSHGRPAASCCCSSSSPRLSSPLARHAARSSASARPARADRRVLAGIGVATGLVGWRGAIVAGLGLAMSATAIALKILEDRGDLQQTTASASRSCFRTCRSFRSWRCCCCSPRAARPTGFRRAPVGRQDRAARSRRRGRRPLAVQPFPAARRHRRARGDDRGRAAGRARRRRADADRRHAMALGAFLAGMLLANQLPPRARPTSSRSAACCSRCSSGVGMLIDVAVRANWALIAAAALAIGAQDGGVAPGSADLRHIPRRAARRRRAHGGGRVRLRADPIGVALGVLSAAGQPVRRDRRRHHADRDAARFAHRGAARPARPARAPDEIDGVRGSILLVGFGRFRRSSPNAWSPKAST